MTLAPWLLLASEAEGSGSPFSLEPGLIVWTWIVFIALFLVLRRWAWPALVRATEERERRIQKQVEEAERLNAEARRLLDEHKALVAGARAEAQDIVARAKTVAQKERDALLAKGHEEQERLLERARREIAEERDKAVQALRREAVELSIAAASRVVAANLDSEANRRLVTEYLAGLKSEGR
jgi:F-type H+-transporting ATPase subunit b